MSRLYVGNISNQPSQGPVRSKATISVAAERWHDWKIPSKEAMLHNISFRYKLRVPHGSSKSAVSVYASLHHIIIYTAHRLAAASAYNYLENAVKGQVMHFIRLARPWSMHVKSNQISENQYSTKYTDQGTMGPLVALLTRMQTRFKISVFCTHAIFDPTVSAQVASNSRDNWKHISSTSELWKEQLFMCR